MSSISKGALLAGATFQSLLRGGPFVASLRGGGGGGSSDPHFANVVLLASADGADGAQTFTDHSTYGRALTPTGNVQADTDNPMFGAATMLFDGNGDYLSSPDAGELDLADNDFTLETWLYLETTSAWHGLVSHWHATYRAWQLYFGSGKVQFTFFSGGSQKSVQEPTATLTAGTWNHIALDRSGDTFRLYINGELRVTSTQAFAIDPSTGPLELGRMYGSSTDWLNGAMAETRLTVGVARYASDDGFEVPTEPYPRGGPAAPEPTNLFTNGDFTTDLSGWTAPSGNWTASGGEAVMGATSSYTPLNQTAETVAGQDYTLTFDVSSISGTMTFRRNGGAEYLYTFSTTGSHSVTFTATSANDYTFARHTAGNLTIDNVTLLPA